LQNLFDFHVFRGFLNNYKKLNKRFKFQNNRTFDTHCLRTIVENRLIWTIWEPALWNRGKFIFSIFWKPSRVCCKKQNNKKWMGLSIRKASQTRTWQVSKKHWDLPNTVYDCCLVDCRSRSYTKFWNPPHSYV
jgi:hypothetical protein